jgi:PAS domain S-box-containing protein
MCPKDVPSTSSDAERGSDWHLIGKNPEELRALITGLLGSDPGAFIVLDREWRLVYLNSGARKFFVGNDESLIGRPFEDVYLRRFHHVLSPQTIRRLFEGKENTITRYVNQFCKWFKVSAYESDSGVFIRLEDVTKEMFSNRLLRLNEFSVYNARDMVFWLKPSGHIIYANTASCNLLGFVERELTSMMIENIDPSFTNSKWNVFVEELKIKGSAVYESRLQACNRSIIPVEVTYNYLVYYGEEYLIAFARDIAERKKAEEELRHAHSDLEKKVEERTKELVHEKMEAELYLDLICHDISNIHQIIEGQLELAQEIMAEEGTLVGDEKELIDTPLQILERSARLIDSVRKLRQLRTSELKAENIDLSVVINDVVSTYANIRGKDIILDYTPLRGCYVKANPLLKDVFINLVDNAVKHSNGSIHIGIKVDRVDEHGNRYYRIAIEDNGPGIPDAMKEQIFNRLMRGQTQARGTGLGLYIVKTLLEGFHGKVKVEDRVPGDHTKGSRFLVYLPIADGVYGE